MLEGVNDYEKRKQLSIVKEKNRECMINKNKKMIKYIKMKI